MGWRLVHSPFRLTALAAGMLVYACCLETSGASSVIMRSDFDVDPSIAGWTLESDHNTRGVPIGAWTPGGGQPPAPGSLSVERGRWQSPSFVSTPHHYYRLTFQSKADAPGYWAAMFFDAEGVRLEADHNSGIFVSETWIDNEFYFQGKADAIEARLWFYPVRPRRGQTVGIRQVHLSHATDEQVLDWADRLYASLPQVEYEPPADRWTHIPNTMRNLSKGEGLRIVILGDSIANDTGNAPLDKLIQRQYPGSRVEVITSVRGGTGSPYYRQDGRVAHYVTRYAPDLVMIIAISHGYDLDAIRDVIGQIRATCAAEIMLLTGFIAQEGLMTAGYAALKRVSGDEAVVGRKAFLRGMAELAVEESIEFLPLRRIWNDYLASAAPERDTAWFMRDETHANVRGRQIVARILERYFAPK